MIAGYDPKVWPVPLAYDSKTPAGVFNCYLQHPCSVWHDVPGGAATDDTTEVEEPSRADSTTAGDPEYPPELFPEIHNLPGDTNSQLSAEQEIYDFPYTFVELQNRYEINNGWRQMPVAQIDPNKKSAALIKLHGKTAKRVLTMTATRQGKAPVIPSMVEDTTDPNNYREVLSDIQVIGKAPQLMADGQGREFQVLIEYTYLMERAPTPTDKLRTGSLPMDKFSPNSNWLDLAEIVDTSGELQKDDQTTTFPTA